MADQDGVGQAGSDPSMGFSLHRPVTAYGYFEPSASVQFLPACKNCGTKHPLAHRPALPADLCPACGAPTEPLAPPTEEPAVLTGYHPTSLLARALLSVGKALNQLANRI
jgi:hypothetical protein